MNSRERFIGVMDYEPVDRVPNWEAGVWPQTKQRWISEGLDASEFHWDWFSGEKALDMDLREFSCFNGGMIPPFEKEVLEDDGRTKIVRDASGRVRRTLAEGAIGDGSMSMDEFLRFPVENMDDWQEMKKRFDPTDPRRYEENFQQKHADGWASRTRPLIFGPNTSTGGFYWIGRGLMGTEGLCYAWYDHVELVDDMMSFWADFLIESAKPMLAVTTVDYICLSEDLAMKTGPLLSPDTYKRFIFPHLSRVIDFYKSNGVRHVCVDTDGNPEALLPLMIDAGVDAIWPLERAADCDPIRFRKKFGRSLRLWGGVDKRELAKGPDAIDAHLRTLLPLIEEGGFIPTVDHTVPPDVSWTNFQYYMESKKKFLAGKL